jgi:hypothetical protein
VVGCPMKMEVILGSWKLVLKAIISTSVDAANNEGVERMRQNTGHLQRCSGR